MAAVVLVLNGDVLKGWASSPASSFTYIHFQNHGIKPQERQQSSALVICIAARYLKTKEMQTGRASLHAYTYLCMHGREITKAHTHTHAQTEGNVHSQTHTHTHTHTLIQTLSLGQSATTVWAASEGQAA